MANYRVDGNKVYAVITKLTDKETKEVKKYIELGFQIVAEEPKKLTKEEKKEKAAANKAEKQKKSKENPYSKENVEKFLKQKGNEELWKEYQERYNEQAGTNRFRKNEAGVKEKIEDEPKVLKSGKPKKKGYANCIGWFTDKFEWDEEAKEYKAK